MTAVDLQTWLFPREIADHLRMSYADVLRALEAGLLVGFQRKKGGSWRVHRDALQTWIDQGTPVPDDRRKKARRAS
jgi:hypothetical protein